MGKRRRTVRWKLALLPVVWFGCGAKGTDVSFVVHTAGIRSSVERFSVRADPILSTGPLRYDGVFYKELSGTFSLEHLPAKVDLMAFDGDTEVSRVSIVPFVCEEAGLLGSGPVTETRSVWIDTDGSLWTTGDFDRPATSKCESPSTQNGAGTVWTSPGYCRDPDRSATEVTIADSTTWQADRCRAVYTNYRDGVLSVVLSFVETGPQASARTATLTLSHCLLPEETFPRIIGLPSTNASACRFDAVSWSSGYAGEPAATFVATAGTWEITTVTFQRGGRIAGSVDVEFDLGGGGSVRGSGQFDLPYDVQRVMAP